MLILGLNMFHADASAAIVVDGEVVGAVGVSGVKSAEDAQIARSGINLFLENLNR